MMEFLPLKAADYGRLKGLFAGVNHPHSEYSLSSLILWNGCVMETTYACDGDAVFLAETSVEDPAERFLLLPVSARTPYPPERLKAKALEAGFPEYRFVHDDYVAAHGMDEIRRHFAVEEQAVWADYVYRTADLASLEGRDLAKKRNHVRRFEKDCGLNAWRLETARLSAANAAACSECLERWRIERPDKDWTRVLECERRAITAALGSFDALELRGLMILLNGAVQGFAIAAGLSRDTGDLLFEKAADRYKGLYQYLDREAARYLFDGWEFINKESDQGDPGLAKAKESYHPIRRVKAYRLRVPGFHRVHI